MLTPLQLAIQSGKHSDEVLSNLRRELAGKRPGRPEEGTSVRGSTVNAAAQVSDLFSSSPLLKPPFLKLCLNVKQNVV